MIISASYKTDIPTFYGEWFMNRLRAGSCKMVNPYGRQIYTVSLAREDVDGVVFWTKNIGPFMKHLPEIRERGYPFVVQHTINGYPRELESRVIDYSRTVQCMHELAEQFGPEVAIWRYDPIFITSITPIEWHIEKFARLAEQLEGATNEVVFSFAHIYKKTARNTQLAARNTKQVKDVREFTWEEHEATGVQQRVELLQEFAKIARKYKIQLNACSQPEYVSTDGSGLIGEAKCVEADRLKRVAKHFGLSSDIKDDKPKSPNRKGCECSASRDIGEYDTCPHGCVYCYATQDRDVALKRFRHHDSSSEFLFTPDEKTLEAARQKEQQKAEEAQRAQASGTQQRVKKLRMVPATTQDNLFPDSAETH